MQAVKRNQYDTMEALDDDDLDPLRFTVGRSTRVFIAEDDSDMRVLIGHALARDGYDVVEAEDGLELLDYLQEALEVPLNMPDLIITDVMMPIYSGLNILEALRKANWVTPVIVLTALGEEGIRQKARELGACAFLKKPFDIDELRSAVVSASLSGARTRGPVPH